MANLIEITREETPEKKEWLNLDQVFHLAVMPHPDTNNNMVDHVMVFQEPGGNGLVLPLHISIEEVLFKMNDAQINSITVNNGGTT